MAPQATELARRLESGVARVIVGNASAAYGFLVTLLCGGHILLEGRPGTAKTLFVRTFAALIDAPFRRIQFTPDLMPADVLGTTIFNPQTLQFTLRRGPIFTSILLADEINRTPPKTQSALLEAMEERHVTLDGETQALPELFTVCATQNPIEFEGTYPLPEAQLDRFLVRARTGYPSEEEERTLYARSAAGFDARDLRTAGVTAVATPGDLLAAQREVRALHIAAPVQAYIGTIVARTRTSSDLALGASVRAGLALQTAAQSAAVIEGRDFATPDDVKSVAPLVLAHRLIVRPEAEVEGVTAERVVERILASVEVPKEAERTARAADGERASAGAERASADAQRVTTRSETEAGPAPSPT